MEHAVEYHNGGGGGDDYYVGENTPTTNHHHRGEADLEMMMMDVDEAPLLTWRRHQQQQLAEARGGHEMMEGCDAMYDEDDYHHEYSSCRRRRGTTLDSLPRDAMNVLTSFLTLTDFMNLSLCNKQCYESISQASHLFMDDPIAQQPLQQSQQNQQQQHHNCHQRGAARTEHENSYQVYAPSGTDTVHHHASSSSKIGATHLRVAPNGRISDKFLTQILARYRNLTVLQLSGLAPIGDSLFNILNNAAASPQIQSLSLNGVSLTYWCQDRLQLKHLRELRITSSSIRASLDLLIGGTGDNEDNDATTSNGSSSSSKLESLTLSQCSSLRDDHLGVLVSRLGRVLKKLTLTQCLRLRFPVISLPALEHLNLMGSFALQGLPGFFCPHLKTLDLSFCFRLKNDCISSIIEALPQIEELTLVKCLLLRELTVKSASLRYLNVNYCDSLQTLRLVCPQLEQLDNESCSSLSTLILTEANSLKDLNVTVLPVQTLEVVAPQLSELNLVGCRRLDSCVISAPNLQRVNVRGSRTVALRFCREVRSVQMKNWTRMPYHF